MICVMYTRCGGSRSGPPLYSFLPWIPVGSRDIFTPYRPVYQLEDSGEHGITLTTRNFCGGVRRLLQLFVSQYLSH